MKRLYLLFMLLASINLMSMAYGNRVFRDGDYDYEVIDEERQEVSLVKYYGEEENIILPDAAKDENGREYQITTIGDYVFSGNSNLTDFQIL